MRADKTGNSRPITHAENAEAGKVDPKGKKFEKGKGFPAIGKRMAEKFAEKPEGKSLAERSVSVKKGNPQLGKKIKKE